VCRIRGKKRQSTSPRKRASHEKEETTHSTRRHSTVKRKGKAIPAKQKGKKMTRKEKETTFRSRQRRPSQTWRGGKKERVGVKGGRVPSRGEEGLEKKGEGLHNEEKLKKRKNGVDGLVESKRNNRHRLRPAKKKKEGGGQHPKALLGANRSCQEKYKGEKGGSKQEKDL